MLPESVARFIDSEVAAAPATYDDLRVVVLNGTLKRSPETSHTDGLLAVTRRVLEGVGARVDVVRLVDHVIPPGVQPDLREHGWERDDFPDIYRSLVEPADIVVLATPIWLGDQSSVTRLTIERLYGWSGSSTRTASGATTARSAVSSSPATRTAASTARPRCSTP
jgi:multimeric flavodoxin WrbA